MVKYFYLLVATILISCVVYPAIAATSSALPPGYPQTKETVVTMTDLPQGATVHVDNIKVGTVSTIHPSQSLQFGTTPGTHKLQIQALGYQPWTGSFTINSGERKTIMVTLSPMPRKTTTVTPFSTPTPKPVNYLTVEVSPDEATISIDGGYGSNSPVGSPLTDTRSHIKRVTYSISPGTHTIRATAPGYQTHTEQVKIDSGDRSHISITLERDPNYIEMTKFDVKTRPSGASVYVDGKLNGTTPCKVSASVGTHTVVLRLEGYQEQTHTMDLTSTMSQSLSVQLVQGVGPLSTPEPIQTEMVRAATASPSQSTTISSASTQPEETKDVLQYVVYFFRGLFGGKQ